MKLNNKGFTLVEVLAVIVILGVLSTIMISASGSMMKKNKEDNYENLKKSITSAAKVFISDHRYDISLDQGTSCSDSDKRNIEKITVNETDVTLVDSKISLKMLVDAKNLSTNKKRGSENVILNPLDDKEINLEKSNISVKYNCQRKDYDYEDVYIENK